MEIYKRPSSGRGEYEIAGSYRSIKHSALTDKEFVIDARPVFGLIPTGIHLVMQGGKPRLRRMGEDRSAIQMHRQIEALTLLPKSIRDEGKLPGGEPVILRNRYLLQRIEISGVKIIGAQAIVRFGAIDCFNGSLTKEINFRKRLAEIGKVLTEMHAYLPSQVAEKLDSYKSVIGAGAGISKSSEATVDDLIAAVQEAAADCDIPFIDGGDPLEALKELAGVPIAEAPPSVEGIDPEDVEIRRRVAERWRKNADRGPNAAKFRKDVRSAYRSTCLVCGLKLAASDLRIPGVDAAHILPWADYDLDVVENGLCLCKLHHWAFDQLLLAVVPDTADNYRIVLTPLACEIFKQNKDALDELRKHEGTVRIERLPSDRNLWPRAAFLKKFYEGVLLDIS